MLTGCGGVAGMRCDETDCRWFLALLHMSKFVSIYSPSIYSPHAMLQEARIQRVMERAAAPKFQKKVGGLEPGLRPAWWLVRVALEIATQCTLPLPFSCRCGYVHLMHPSFVCILFRASRP